MMKTLKTSRLQLILIRLSFMLALVLTACETTRTNAPQKVRNSTLTRCSTIAQCERVSNG